MKVCRISRVGLDCGEGGMEGAGSVNFAEPSVLLALPCYVLQQAQVQAQAHANHSQGKFARDVTAPPSENTSDRLSTSPSDLRP